MEHRKVVTIGAGHVGSHCAYALAAGGYGKCRGASLVVVAIGEPPPTWTDPTGSAGPVGGAAEGAKS